MDESDARARDIALANLRVEVSTLTERVGASSLPQAASALSSIRRTVLLAAVLVSASLLASSSIHACSAREIRDLRLRVDRFEGGCGSVGK